MSAKKNNKPDPPLSEQGHKQIMDYLRMAEKSKNPAIRRKALQLADDTSRYERKQKARVPAWLILLLNILFVIAVALSCRFAILHYSGGKAAALCSIYIGLYLPLAGISLFMTDRLSQQNLMKLFKPLMNMKFSKWPFGKSDNATE